MLTCKLCSKQMKGLTLHLIKMHCIKPVEYLANFPGEKIFSDEVLKGETFGGRSMKGKQTKPFTDEHRKKISDARKLIVGQTHSVETKAKMSAAWQKPNRDERIAAIALRSGSYENRQRLSAFMKAKIERNGFHLKRGKQTALELTISNVLTEAKLSYFRERRSHIKINGVYRYYDFYLPDLRLIIEADGEFWHMLDGKLEIDRLKGEAIEAEGLTLLRISDRYDKQLIKQPNLLLALILSEQSLIIEHTNTVILNRAAALALKADQALT